MRTDGIVLYSTDVAEGRRLAAVVAGQGHSGVLMEVVEVDNSLARLDAVAERITEDRSDLAQQGTRVTSWELDLHRNRVRVVLDRPFPDPDPAQLTAARLLLEDRYGANLVDVAAPGGWVAV